MKRTLKQFHLVRFDTNKILYRTFSPHNTISQLEYLNNSYVLVKEFPSQSHPTVEDIIRSITQDVFLIKNSLAQFSQKRQLSFRVMGMQQSTLVSVSESARIRLEEAIQKSTNTKVNRSKPDVEYIAQVVKENVGFFLIRFTHRDNYEKTLRKGELYPELAFLLNLLSVPEKNDVFLDPFCGSGSIAIDRAKYFVAEKIYATDTDKSATNFALLKAKKLRRRIEIFNWNALDLRFLENEQISRIVTDPPWDIQNLKFSGGDLADFYRQMLREFYRVLKPFGICVILIQDEQAVETALKTTPGFKVSKRIDTIVSGRKAFAYKLFKP
jgi:tRNA G10  N-methylase Trm11